VDTITISMTKYLKDHPRMKYIFFGGKGGVGKTVMAGTAALWSAKQGKRTLLASTNPVHSLSSLLEQDVFAELLRLRNRHQGHDRAIQKRDPEKDELVSQVRRYHDQSR
jgi:cellulose biosynthesis protein BcsQ